MPTKRERRYYANKILADGTKIVQIIGMRRDRQIVVDGIAADKRRDPSLGGMLDLPRQARSHYELVTIEIVSRERID